MKFNPLNVPTHWQNYWTRFPEGHTILEALIQWVSQVDDMVDNQNKLNTTVENYGFRLDEFLDLFDTNLRNTAEETLKDWQSTGFLNVVISDALQWQLDGYITTNEQDKLSLNQQLHHIDTVKIGGSVKAELENLSPNVLSAIDGTGGPFNLETIPQDYSVTPVKTTFLDITQITPTIIMGKYINYTGNIATAEVLAYSEPIALKKNESIDFEALGYLDNIAMISEAREDGTILEVKVLSVDSTVRNYTYTASKEIEHVVLSWSTQAPIKVTKYPNLMKQTKQLETDVYDIFGSSIGFREVSLEPIYDLYVNFQGTITDAVNFSYSQHIPLSKGEKITFKATGYEQAVSMISRFVGEGVRLKPLVLSVDSNEHDYLYTAQDNEVIVLSWRSLEPASVKIYSDILQRVETLENGVDTNQIYHTLNMFESAGFCGDSYVKGQIYVDGVSVGSRPHLSWGATIGKLNGIEANIYASGGADTDTYQSRSDCLPKLLSETPKGLYIFCLGINDYSYVEKGTFDDIKTDYNDNPNTFYGNYGKIIEQVKTHAPDSKIILMTPFYKSDSAIYDYSFNALEEIANHYNVAFVDTAKSTLAQSEFYMDGMVGGHPTAPLYSAMGKEITDLVNMCIQDNYNYFKDYTGVEPIG